MWYIDGIARTGKRKKERINSSTRGGFIDGIDLNEKERKKERKKERIESSIRDFILDWSGFIDRIAWNEKERKKERKKEWTLQQASA